MHRHMATRTLQLFAVVLFGLALAACGSDGADTASTTSTAVEEDDTTTTTEAASETSTTTTSEAAGESSTTSTTSTAITTTTSVPPDLSSLVVAGTGLVIEPDTDDSITLDFGADRAVVIAAVSSVFGAVPVESEGSTDCPNFQATVATWPDLILDFDANDGFLSWRLPIGSQLTDADGLGLGTARSDLGSTLLASIEETSLGTEFGMKGSVSGLLSGPEETATVDVLWAGDICAFR